MSSGTNSASYPPLRPFLSYYGSKWRLAPHYPEPKHRTIIEPFAGGAGYGTRWHYHDVILLDKYEPVVGVWDYLIHAPAEEIRSLPILEPQQKVNDLNICQEAKWLIGWWVQIAVCTPRQSLSSAAFGPEGPTHTWSPSVRDRLARQVEHIRHWKVKLGSYEELENQDATWFVDPPYNNTAGSYYPEHGIDYEHLGNWCMYRKGQIIVCENEGADWLPFQSLCEFWGAGKWSKEVVWNG